MGHAKSARRSTVYLLKGLSIYPTFDVQICLSIVIKKGLTIHQPRMSISTEERIDVGHLAGNNKVSL